MESALSARVQVLSPSGLRVDRRRAGWIVGVLFAAASVYWPLGKSLIPPGLGLVRLYDVAVLMVASYALIGGIGAGATVSRGVVAQTRLLVVGLYLTVIVRIGSVAWSPFGDWPLLWSVGRYAEALMLVLSALVLPASFRDGLRQGLIAFGFAETGVAAVQVVTATGLTPGVGIASQRGVYELQVWFALWGLIMLAMRFSTRRAWLLVIAGVGGVAVTMIRTAWLQLVIGVTLGTFLLRGKPRRTYLLWAAAAILLLFPSIGALAHRSAYARYKLIQVVEGGGSTGERLTLWSIGLEALRRSPLLGIGTGAFARHQNRLAEDAGLPVPREFVEMELSTHNMIIGIMTETGLLGLGAYLAYALGVLRLGRGVVGSRGAFDPSAVALSATLASMVVLDAVAASSFAPLTLALLLLGIFELRPAKRR